MRVFIKRHSHDAGKWIYRGYASAWESLGYDVVLYDFLSEIPDSIAKESYLMTLDSCIIKEGDIDKISSFEKTFLYVQPNIFPDPWGSHSNFVSSLSPAKCKEITNRSRIFQWTFVDPNKEYYSCWDPITIPLAFDSINYSHYDHNDCDFSYDVCYVGGRANNGFDEKYRIMLDIFSAFATSGLKCGFFINKGLTHEQENSILRKSRVAINIHDGHQRALGLDTNERTFKSLGVTGALVSDNVQQAKSLFPQLPVANTPQEMVSAVKEMLSLADGELVTLKEKNRNEIIQNHTYIKRVERMISL